jgi:flagellin-like protein
MKMGEKAVSEIIGAIVLLAMAVAVFSVIYMNVLADDGPTPDAFLTVIGKIDDNFDVIFDHTLGEEIYINSPVDITIGGHPLENFVDYPCETVSDLLSDEFKEDDNWNIGEQLVCPLDEEFADYEITAYISDIESNSLVFWGILQDGKMFNGFGGIWHFNESYWDGKYGEVEDSSGNGNHGTAYNDANTHYDVVSSSANRSGYFNYLDDINDDDRVVVPDSLSLDIRKQITIEAWIKPFYFDISKMGKIEDKFGYTPYITHVSENLFVIVSEDANKNGMIQTVNITPYGNLSEVLYQYPNFGESKSNRNLRPFITHVSNDIYVVAYIDKDLYVHLKTFNVSSIDGFIQYTENELTFDDSTSVTNIPNRPSIIKVTDEIFAVAFWSDPAVGIIKTVNISSEGVIDYTGNDLIFDDVQGYEPCIVHVAGDLFAVAYRGSSDYGYIKTFNISSEGVIDYTGNDLIFDDINSSFDPYIIYHSDKNYIITYSTNKYPGNPVGNYVSIEFADNGSIILSKTPYTFQYGRCYTPIPIKISNRIFAVIYEGFTAHEGDLLLILVEYPSDLTSSGIYKLGSYGMYANSDNVYVHINNNLLSYPISNETWNHIVLTYNKSAATDQMKLYVNGDLKTKRTLKEIIKRTKSDLIFGELIFGLIDEVAIFNHELTQEQILIHFNNPGIFEEGL